MANVTREVIDARKLASMVVQINSEQRSDTSVVLKDIARVLTGLEDGDNLHGYLRTMLNQCVMTYTTRREEEDLWKILSTLVVNRRYLGTEFGRVARALEQQLVIGFAWNMRLDSSPTTLAKLEYLACLGRQIPYLEEEEDASFCEEICKCTANVLGTQESLHAAGNQAINQWSRYGDVFYEAVM